MMKVKTKTPDGRKKLPTDGGFLTFRHSLIGESCSALLSSSLENLASVRSAHSFSEAMLLLSLTNLRLISSKHFNTFFQTIVPGFRHFGQVGTAFLPACILRQLLL